MKHYYSFGILLIIGALLLAACNNEGLAAFSPTNDRALIVTNSTHLYSTDIGGSSATKLETDGILPGFDVTFDPFGTKVLYAKTGSICLVNAGGGGQSCPVSLPSGVTGGFLSFLPDGDFVFIYKSGDVWEMRIFRTDGGLVTSDGSINQFFLAMDAYKVKRGANGREWYMRPYNKPSGSQSLRWVITRGTQAIMYNAGGTLQGPIVLAREINSAVQTALAGRDQLDITSGAISPDGTKMVFRTGDQDHPAYSLYALDLSTNSGSFIQLVTNANFRIQFDFSPDGSELVYESNFDGRSVWIAKADGTNARKLADNAALPDWH